MDYLDHESLSLFSGDSVFTQLKPLHEDLTVVSPVTTQSQDDTVSDKSELQKLLEGSSSYMSCVSQASPLLSPEQPSTPEADWLDMKVDLQDLLPDIGLLGELTCDSLDASDVFTALATPLMPSFMTTNFLHGTVLQQNDHLKTDDTDQLPDVDFLFHDLSNLDVDTGTVDIEPVLSPVSIEDVESLLSSGPASPSGSLSADSESSFSVASSDVSDNNCKSGGSIKRGKDREAACPYRNKSGRETKLLDKKLRKKQQNKDAALRYRVKKKAESVTIESDLRGLEGRNKKLKDTVDQMTREIQYLKDLMAEVYKADISKSSYSNAC